MDEVDAYPASASSGGAGTEEGDPLDLAIRRTGTFANRQIAMVSTPTIAEASRIEAAYLEIRSAQVLPAVSALRRVPGAALDPGEVVGPEARRRLVRVRAMPRAYRGPSQARHAAVGPVAKRIGGRR